MWQVLKTDASSEELTPVRHGDIIQLRHVKTDRLLMTHDVASPLLPTNTEYTTVPDDQLDRYNDTLFEVRFDSLELGTQWQSHMTPFQLIHVPTGVALFSQNKKWPEWAGYKYDVNGNKRLIDRGNRWIVHDVIGRKRKLQTNGLSFAFIAIHYLSNLQPVMMKLNKRKLNT